MDGDLPGRQGRLAFAYLTLNRHRVVTRSALADAIWPVEAPALVDTALSSLISKLRKAIGSDTVVGRSDVRLVLPDAWVDVEAASEAIHRAEGAVGRGAWAEAWGPGRVALHIVRREFLPGESGGLGRGRAQRARGRRAARARVHRQVESRARAERAESAVRSGRDLVRLAPHRESGYRILMRSLAAEGNDAEALGVYEGLRVRLREDLGVAPSAPTQELYRTLLR